MQANSMKNESSLLVIMLILLLSTIFSCSYKGSLNSGSSPNDRTNEGQFHQGSSNGNSEAEKGVTLYIVTSKEGCECFLDLCKELRTIGKDFATKYGDRIEVKLLDNDSDFQEVDSLREAHHLFLLPYVVLVDRRENFENVLYMKSGFEEAGPVLKELEMWVEFSMSAGESSEHSAKPMKGE